MKTKLILVLFFILFFNFTLAYSPYNTHQFLTEEIVNFYNLTTEGRKISSQELEWLKQGTADEDYPPRWLHHFYNPLTKKGWTGKRLGKLSAEEAFYELKKYGLMAYEPVSSLIWAQDHLRQAQESEIWTWNRAIAYYGQEKYEKAFKALGHILHLLQDLTVPEHVRDDAHPDIGILGEIEFFKKFTDGSPYEEWAKNYTLSNYGYLNLAKDLFSKGEKPYSVNSLEDAFHNLASFVNQNFFSPDTIFDPEFPKPSREDVVVKKDGFLYNKKLNVKIAQMKDNKFEVTEKVAQDIWYVVTPELLKYGAGLIDYFFKEAERTKQDSDILETYIWRTGISQIEYALYSYDVYQTSFLTQAIRFFNFVDKLTSGVKLTYYKIKNQTLSQPKTQNELTMQNQLALSDNSTIQEQDKELTLKTELSYQNLSSPNLESSRKETQESKNITFLNNQNNDNFQTNLESAKIEKEKQNKQEIKNSKDQANLIPTLKPITSTLSFKKDNQTSIKSQDQNQSTNQNQSSFQGSSIYFAGGPATVDNLQDECESLKSKSFPKILINALKFEGENTKDEFIELYNPNDFEVDLTCWSLKKKTAGESEGEFSNLISKKSFKGKIPPYSFFLIVHPSSTFANLGDISYSSPSYSFSKNNVLALFNPKDEIVDLVGFGDDQTKIRQKEGEPFIFENLPKGAFLARKNFQDTDNNSQDFWIVKRNPYNSSVIKKPSTKIYFLNEFTLEKFEIYPQEKQLFVFIKDPLIPQDHQPFKAKLSFGENNYFLDLNFDGQEKTFILPVCPPIGNFQGEFLIYDEENELNFIATTSQFEIKENFCQDQKINKIVISEVLIESTSSASDEFIELYNPNSFPVDLSTYKIVKKTQSGRQTTLLSSKTNPPLTGILPPYSYFLITNSSSTYSFLADIVYPYSSSKALAKNNSLLILDENDNAVDILGWGEAFSYETQTTTNPEPGFSFERKVSPNSTAQSLRTQEINFGNYYDSDNNLNDFVLQPQPLPQNSSVKKLLPNMPSNFKVKTYFSDLNLENKYLSWYEKVKPQNQIIKFVFNEPLVNDFPNSNYLISYTYATSEEKKYLPLDKIPVGDSGNLKEIDFNVCNLRSGPYNFFLEIQTQDNQNLQVASTTFFKDPFLYPCPPQPPKVKVEIASPNYTPYYTSGDFLQLSYYDADDTDFLATPIDWQNIPSAKSFFIIKIATSPEMLSDENFFKAKDLWGFNYWFTDSPNRPNNLALQPGEHQVYIDLFDFENNKTYYIGVKAFSVYDFLYYGSYPNLPQPCKVANFRTRFHDLTISASDLNCFFTHLYVSSAPKIGQEAISFSEPWGLPNFYDSESHPTPIPIYQTDLGYIELEHFIQNYPYLLSSTTIVSFTVTNKIQEKSKIFSYARFFEQDGKLYFEFSPKNKMKEIRDFVFRIVSIKNNELTPVTLPEIYFNLVFPEIWVNVQSFDPNYNSYFNANYSPDNVYRILVMENYNYKFDKSDIFMVGWNYTFWGGINLDYDPFRYFFDEEYRF